MDFKNYFAPSTSWGQQQKPMKPGHDADYRQIVMVEELNGYDVSHPFWPAASLAGNTLVVYPNNTGYDLYDDTAFSTLPHAPHFGNYYPGSYQEYYREYHSSCGHSSLWHDPKGAQLGWWLAGTPNPFGEWSIGSIAVNEAALANGTSDKAQHLYQIVWLPPGYTLDTTGWVKDGDVFVKQHDLGLIKYNGTHIVFELTESVDHNTGTGDRFFTTVIKLPVIHPDGSTSERDLTVNVGDDTPEVLFYTLTDNHEIGSTTNGKWSVNYGVDGKASDHALQVSFDNGRTFQDIDTSAPMNVIIDGINYGTVMFNADGTFAYTSTQTITNGTLHFVLKATDGDQDSTYNDLILQVTGDPDLVPNHTMLVTANISEASLANGTDQSLKHTVVLTDIPRGYKIDTTDWEKSPNKWEERFTKDLGYGVLEYTKGKLIFKLTSAVDNNTGTLDDKVTHLIDLTLKSASGETLNKTVAINIIDDRPAIEFWDAPSHIDAGETMTGTWGVNYGADGAAAANALQISFDRGRTYHDVTFNTPMDVIIDGVNYGSWVMNANNTFSFACANSALNGKLAVLIKATDGDGDSSVGHITFCIDGAEGELPPGVGPNINSVNVDEANLALGTAQNASDLEQVIGLPAGYTVITTGWAQSGSVFTKAVDNGVLTYDGTTLTYTLTDNVANAAGEDSATKVIDLLLSDPAGKKVISQLSVVIEDDAPLAEITDSGKVLGGQDLNGAWDVNYGADGQATADALQVSFDNGATFASVTAGVAMAVSVGGVNYGTITFNADNTYVFSADANATAGTIDMVLKGMDSDGDTNTASASIQVVPATIPGFALGSVAVEEQNLANGTDPEADALIQSVAIPAGFTVDTTGWVAAGGSHTLAVTGGVLTYDGTDLTYTLQSAVQHTAGESSVVETINLVLLDENDSQAQCTIQLSIEDDSPEIVKFDSDSSRATPGSVFTGSWEVNYGADGESDVQAMQVSLDNGNTFHDIIVGTPTTIEGFGVLEFSADGWYTFDVANDAELGVQKVMLQISDGEGDIEQASFEITFGGLGRVAMPALLDMNTNDSLDQFFGEAEQAAVALNDSQVLASMKHETSNFVNPAIEAQAEIANNQAAEDELLRALANTL